MNRGGHAVLARRTTVRLRFPAVLALVALLAGLVGAPAHAEPRKDADHYEFYFASSDGINQLHADVLRRKGLGLKVRTPVILTVSPYVNHSGSTSPHDLTGEGPNPRFYDFLDLTGVLKRGYTYVMVDLPGDGGSGGCNDWGGAREQAGVRDAVEWAASQPWSTGKVALLGKSYDAWTGLMGVAQQPKGLAAVVAMEPVYSGYRYKYMNGVRRPNFFATMALFQVIDAMPGRPSDPPEYHISGASQGWCYPINMAGTTADDSESGPYWTERNLVPTSKKKTTPVFLMQGFLETNTKPDGAFEYFNGLAGDDSRAWFGQFDHVRGWEKTSDGKRFHTGRSDYIEQLDRFLDLHLKGIKPDVEDPPVEVQDNRGRWRAEESWPPPDSRMYRTELRTGTFTDSGLGRGVRPSETQGIWSVSPKLRYDVWFSGEPVIDLTVDAMPNANLAANVYDVAPDGKVTMLSRGVQLLRGTGEREFTVTLYGQDWLIPAGHHLGVLLSSANTDEFLHVATWTPVTVLGAKIALPFLTFDRTRFLKGRSTPRLEAYLKAATSALSETTIAEAEIPFDLPSPLRASPKAKNRDKGN